MCPQPQALPPAPPDFSLTFPPDPAWVRTCRETVRTSATSVTRRAGEPGELAELAEPGEPGELAELAVLLTSEAATNAVTASVAAATPYPITLYGEWLAHGLLRIHVRDAAPGAPALRTPGEDAESGRGLHLIAALATRYGTCVDGPGPGKSFWFQLERPRATAC